MAETKKAPGQAARSKPMPARNTQSAKAKALIYLGPDIPGGILHSGNIYTDYPETMKDLFAAVPEVRQLFVDVEKIVEYKQNANRRGTAENRLLGIARQKLLAWDKERGERANGI